MFKCSRTFLIPTQAGRGTEVNFLPLLLYFCGVSTVFAEVPDPGMLITLDGQLVAGSAILCMSNSGPPHVLMTAATGEGLAHPSLPNTPSFLSYNLCAHSSVSHEA